LASVVRSWKTGSAETLVAEAAGDIKVGVAGVELLAVVKLKIVETLLEVFDPPGSIA
jgi:hypothetical protein